MLHTLSHLLIRELALECGYNAASIRERIYADTTGGAPQAGILIYTAAADSDGTLGGLVDLGKPENLGRLLTQALNRAKICSSDPLCSEHDPEKDRSLHVAACHACSLVAETSCERGNRYLDRSLLIPTLERVDAAFFQGLDTLQAASYEYSAVPAAAHGEDIGVPHVGSVEPDQPLSAASGHAKFEPGLRLSDLAENFPKEPFVLRVINGSKVVRVRVRPVPSADLVAGQRVVMACPSLQLRGSPVSAVTGVFAISERIDAATDESFVLVSIKGEGGLAQARLSKAEWQSLMTIGQIEDLT
jgi:hypothetical protein